MNNMQFSMTARIDKAVISKGKYRSNVTVPAPDSYSDTTSYIVYSVESLGDVGAEVKLVCDVSGYIRDKKWTDKDTGVVKRFDEGNVFLNVELAIEAVTKKQVAA